VSNQARAETPVDLDTCEREPIHVPGAVQPHGVLLALSEPDLVVRQVSSNSASVVGLEPADLLGRRLPDVLAGALASAVQEASSDASDPTEHFPLSTDIEVRGEVHQVDALLHRTGDVLVVEIEPGAGPLTFDLTYRATRRAVGRINRAVSPGELYAIAAEEVRRLTGFDRVMVYRFDAEWNGQVVAEDKTDELNSFLGLRYPASDIPAQARALYTRSWLRVIPDVGYRPAPLVPVDDPQSGEPLDLSHSTLRSVSPIHIEYLQNMGVSASMSISLLDRGNLWGLIACHHYSGPHRPAYEVRAAAEFLGQALSLRLVESTERLDVARALEARSRLAVLTTAINDEARSAAAALTDGPLTVLDLVPATGVAVGLEGGYATVGEVPAPSVVRALVAQAQRRDVDVLALDSVPTELSGLTVPAVHWCCGCPRTSSSSGCDRNRCARSTGAATRTTRRSPRVRVTRSGSARARASTGGGRRCGCVASRGRSRTWSSREPCAPTCWTRSTPGPDGSRRWPRSCSAACCPVSCPRRAAGSWMPRTAPPPAVTSAATGTTP
jgi:light-regulated signal transduction histidine kinase (bacteriophytochrome)